MESVDATIWHPEGFLKTFVNFWKYIKYWYVGKWIYKITKIHLVKNVQRKILIQSLFLPMENQVALVCRTDNKVFILSKSHQSMFIKTVKMTRDMSLSTVNLCS